MIKNLQQCRKRRIDFCSLYSRKATQTAKKHGKNRQWRIYTSTPRLVFIMPDHTLRARLR
jgi:hypothetical protein